MWRLKWSIQRYFPVCYEEGNQDRSDSVVLEKMACASPVFLRLKPFGRFKINQPNPSRFHFPESKIAQKTDNQTFYALKPS
ncbi:hypothetical protein PSSHI_15090 [Photobacterium sp. R1]